MNQQVHDDLQEAIDCNPGDLSAIELNFIAGLLQSYADRTRAAIQKKQGVLGHLIHDVRRRGAVADALYSKVAGLAVQRGDGNDLPSIDF
jgi:hypothetical protein